ncbi:MAG TPA: VCBS repeat-containing protein [bacterium]|nr:VCBS repeat-containing protein [bacterium]
MPRSVCFLCVLSLLLVTGSAYAAGGLLATPSWIYETKETSFATVAGDVNGDGCDDILVADYLYSTTGDEIVRLRLYYGRHCGTPEFSGWFFEFEDHSFFRFAGIGDVNGDGYADVMAYAYFQPIMLFYGSEDGLQPGREWLQEYNFQEIGDVNGDGYDDLIVDGELVFYGSDKGPGNEPDWQFSEDVIVEYAAGHLDFNGDGYGDLIIRSGISIYFYSGGPDGLADEYSAMIDEPKYFFVSSQIHSAGDINGDGVDEIIIFGDQYCRSNRCLALEGGMFIFTIDAGNGNDPYVVWKRYGDLIGWDYYLFLLNEVVGGYDLNGDGFDDVVATLDLVHYPESYDDIYVYLGSPQGFSYEPDLILKNIPTPWGRPPDISGDINGDGCHDLLVTSYGYSSGYFTMLFDGYSENGEIAGCRRHDPTAPNFSAGAKFSLPSADRLIY